MNGRRAHSLALLEAAFLVLAWATGVSVLASGNDGTLKIHEQGTPSGTEDNDPKVCIRGVYDADVRAAETMNALPDRPASLVVAAGDGPDG